MVNTTCVDTHFTMGFNTRTVSWMIWGIPHDFANLHNIISYIYIFIYIFLASLALADDLLAAGLVVANPMISVLEISDIPLNRLH